MQPRNTIEALRANRDAARAEFERLDAEARAIRAQLTTAESKARAARKAYESAMLAYADASEGRQ